MTDASQPRNSNAAVPLDADIRPVDSDKPLWYALARVARL